MTKLVLFHKADSIYDDEPDVVYEFPRRYLKAIEEAVGDWIVYFEPVKSGPRGYFAVAKIARVVPKAASDERYLALIERGSFLPFDREVPRLLNGRPLEASMTQQDGSPKRGGAAQLAVRRLPHAKIRHCSVPHRCKRRCQRTIDHCHQRHRCASRPQPLEARLSDIKARQAAKPRPAPDFPALFAQAVADLESLLGHPDTVAQANEYLSTLIGRVTLTPDVDAPDGFSVEMSADFKALRTVAGSVSESS